MWLYELQLIAVWIDIDMNYCLWQFKLQHITIEYVIQRDIFESVIISDDQG